MAASGGVKRQVVDGQSPGAASSSRNLTDSDFFMQLVRYALYTGQDVNDLKNAASLVILAFEAGAGPPAERRRREWGSKKHFTHGVVLQGLKTLLEAGQSPPAELIKPATDWLKDGMEKKSDQALAKFRPKFALPREDRPWVWELQFAAATPPDFRVMWIGLIRDFDGKISVDVRRAGQVGLEKELWGELRAR
ncbi:unnamed protein product, partial [Prorocentrum cordatum]